MAARHCTHCGSHELSPGFAAPKGVVLKWYSPPLRRWPNRKAKGIFNRTPQYEFSAFLCQRCGHVEWFVGTAPI